MELVMAKQYLFRVEILSKKDKHPLESIAYYSGEKQFDVLNNNKCYETTTDDKVIWSNIIIPDRVNQADLFYNLPDYLKFRSKKADLISNGRNLLWDKVNARENRPDSQFARLFELAVPYFLTDSEGVSLIQSFAKVLISEGMIADCALHNHNVKHSSFNLFERIKLVPTKKETEGHEKSQDYTAFLMCTLRDYKDARFVNKNRNWNNPLKLKEWRMTWLNLLSQSIANASLATEDEKDTWKIKLQMYPDYKNSSTSANKMSM